MVDIYGILSTIGSSLFYVILMIVVAGISAIFVIFFVEYKHQIVIDHETNNGKFTLIKRWRKIKEKDGTEWLQILFNKKKHHLPPPDAVKITKKGKFVVEAYEREGSLIYKKDTGKPDGSYEPLTSTERILYRNQIKKIEEGKKKNISEMIMQTVPFLALIIIIVVAFTYWGEITKPAAAVSSQLEGVSKELRETSTILKEIIQKEQIIRDRGDKPPS